MEGVSCIKRESMTMEGTENKCPQIQCEIKYRTYLRKFRATRAGCLYLLLKLMKRKGGKCMRHICTLKPSKCLLNNVKKEIKD